MSNLPLDKRGYPVPFVTSYDKNGNPDFKVVDQEKVYKIITEKLCQISGRPLESVLKPKGGYWFVGGPKSAFDEYGAYLDAHMRWECARYALRVCPFLAIRGVGHEPNPEKSIMRANLGEMIVLHENAIAGQPDVFVLVQATKISLIETGMSILFKPKAPYRSVEFWHDGEQISYLDARNLSPEVPEQKEIEKWTRNY